MLLKHYVERGVSKGALWRRFGVSRRTIHEWIETGQLDRDLSSGGSRDSPGPPVPTSGIRTRGSSTGVSRSFPRVGRNVCLARFARRATVAASGDPEW